MDIVDKNRGVIHNYEKAGRNRALVKREGLTTGWWQLEGIWLEYFFWIGKV
ncbi:MAG: hypothetical protein ACOYI4_06635 [Christensenellales bacterium]